MSVDDRLSGWKEVAQYLKRGVRTAQRWEKELGLPVHRLKTRNGQVLYAKRSELDAWMTEHAASLSATAVDDAVIHDDVVDADHADNRASVEIVQGRSGLPRAWIAVALTLAVLGFTGYSLNQSIPPEVATVRVGPREISALAHTGQVLWTHDLGQDVAALDVEGLGQIAAEGFVAVDLSGSGEFDRLFPVGFRVAGQELLVTDALFALTDSGQLKWKLQPDDMELTFGRETFRGPWRLTAVHVSSAPGPKRVWASFTHHTWWASFVMEVSPSGESALRYVQPGWVMSLAEWSMDGGTVLAAGGILNELQRGSLVLLDPQEPLTVMKGETPEFSLAVAGADPLRVYTFPPFEVAIARQQAYTMVNTVRRIGEHLRLDFGTFAHVELANDGHVRQFSFTDLYWKEHQALDGARVIQHSVSQCTEPTRTKDIRTWTPSTGWQSTPFEPVPSRSQRVP